MSDKERTQAMPDSGKPRPKTDGTPASRTARDDNLSGGDAGSGGPYPNQPHGSGERFRGGQSNAAYHGTGQLGTEDVDGEENANAGSKSD